MELIEAVERGDSGRVRSLLDSGADPRSQDEYGRNALLAAATEGTQEVVELLLAHDPGLLDLPGPEDRTPLIEAAQSGHVPLVALLLARGADPRGRMEEGGRALDCAAEDGHQEVVELLLTHDPSLLDLPGEEERTALCAAARHGHPELVRMLLLRGADPRRQQEGGGRALDCASLEGHLEVAEALLNRDPQLLELPGWNGCTALAAAAAGGEAELVDLLLSRGADPRRPMDEGGRALDWAAEEDNLEVVERLLAHDPGLLELPGFRERTALLAAAGNGCLEVVQLLLARGADSRVRMHGGGRALDWAAAGGWIEVVEALLAHDPGLLELPGDDECTPVTVAAGNGHAAIVALLIGQGADVRHRMPQGGRALDWAAQEGHVEVVEQLLAHDRGLLDLRGNHERTALIAAASRDHLDVVTRLLARGADAHARTDDGGRALDCAAAEGHEETVEALLKHDPQVVNLPGVQDITPLMAAAAFGHDDLVALLIAHGADPRLRLADGTRALDVAAFGGHESVVERLLAHDPQLLDLAGAGEATALTVAAGEGHTGIVRALLARGADPHRRAADGTIAWDRAQEEGHEAVLEILGKAGAGPS
jgi:serine/threonine-protein phosphatase 6 regulatory ankyrin repeat subunit B